MSHLLKTFLLAAFLIPHSSFLFAQHPAWHQYTTADGLPSNEVYQMLQDSRGFLWFATDLGVCRFNGYEFHRPVDTSTYASNAAFKLAEDAQGRIWFNRLNSSVWFIENDTVRCWKYNPIIKQYQGKFFNLGSLIVVKSGAVWIQLPNLGILVVQPDGSHQVLPSLGGNKHIFATVEGKAICGNEYGVNPNEMQGFTPEIFRWQNARLLSLGRLRFDVKQLKKLKTTGVWQLRNGDIIYNFQQTFYLFHDNRLIWTGVKDIFVNDIFEDSEGALLLASRDGDNRGLLYFRSLQHFLRNEFTNILPDHNVVCTLRDNEGGWWVTTTDAGVFYCKNPGLKIFDTSSGLPFDDVQSITSDEQATIFVGLRPKGVYAIQQQGTLVTPLPTPSGWVNSDQSLLRFDPETQRLWFNPFLCFLEKNRWKTITYERPKPLELALISAKKISTSHSERLWWASSFQDFFSIDPVEGTAVQYKTDSSKYYRTHSVAQDFEGNIWVATEGDGLRIWRNNHYEPPPFDHPALRYPVRLLEILPDSTLLLSLRGGGLLFRRKNGEFTHMTVKDGLSTDWLSELDITPEGVIYASSNAGLNILRPRGNGVWDIETLNTKHGLPSNQVNDVTWLGEELWVATDRGIARFQEKPAACSRPNTFAGAVCCEQSGHCFF